MVGEAIDSALQQTVSAAEIIVVDDGSTDETEARIREYGDRVQYVKTTQGGVAHARNLGMRHASGRYLTFLDSDDQLYPFALEVQTQLLDRFPEVALVCSEMSGFDSRGIIERYHLKTYHRSAYRNPAITYDRIFSSSLSLPAAITLPDVLLNEDPTASSRKVYFGNVFDTYLLNLVLCQNSVMFRRSVLETAGDRNVAVRHWQEVDYLLRITRRHEICFADVPTYKLRYHDGQISTTANANGRYVWMRKQQILLRVVRRHALADRDYYVRHQRKIDAHLAHLHRAVAVPMLLQDGALPRRRRAARMARLYLSRCARYGHPARGLSLAARVPTPFRAAAVQVVESCRQLARTIWWSARIGPRSNLMAA
jgi:glycosyltransferase involved in cell wall biosynthesis